MSPNEHRDLLRTITHDSLCVRRPKNSALPHVDETSEKKGKVYTFRNKEDLLRTKGLVVASYEALVDHESNTTHWTPNVYSQGSYVDSQRTAVCGHSEKKLRQINCFVVDVDYNDSEVESVRVILEKATELGLSPDLVVESQKGYHLYYLLKEPVYLTSASDFRALEVARKINKNIRAVLSTVLPVDMLCNDFGVFRFPSQDAIVFPFFLGAGDLHDETFTFAEWIAWSIEQSGVGIHSASREVPEHSKRQVDTEWYASLLAITDTSGYDTLCRNNLIYTVALANKQSGRSEGEANAVAHKVNDGFGLPLRGTEVDKTVRSAYNGDIMGASREYVEYYLGPVANFGGGGRGSWRAKKREDRMYSNQREWQADILRNLHDLVGGDPYAKTTLKALVEATGVPLTSLKRALKTLTKTKKIIMSSKRGRRGYVLITTQEAILAYCKKKQATARKTLLAGLTRLFGDMTDIAKKCEEADVTMLRAQGFDLFLSG